MDDFAEEQANRLIEAADKALKDFQEVLKSPEGRKLADLRRQFEELGMQPPDDFPTEEELAEWRRRLQWTRKKES